MTLFSHQIAGARWLAGNSRAYLGDAPGLGKTRTALAAAAMYADAKVLVVCPAIVRGHWQREAAAAGVPITVRSYDGIVAGGYALMRQLLEDEGHDTLLLDEAHYLKHATAKRTQLLLGPNGYAKRMARVWLLSGTPIPRHPGELWTVLSSCFPEQVVGRGISRREQFLDRYCRVQTRFIRGQVREKVVGVKDVEDFRKLLNAIMLRRTVNEAAALPPVWWQPLTLDGPTLQEQDYLERGLKAQLEAGIDLETILRDPEVAVYRRRVGEVKAQVLAEQLAEELNAGGGPLVVFAHHRAVLDALEKRLSSFGVARIDGATSPAERERRLWGFCNPRSYNTPYRVFLGQQDACGTGMDGLQAVADRLILVEPNWIATQNAQYAARLARTGQRSPTVIVQCVTLTGTLDDALTRQNIRERRMQTEMEIGT